MTIALEVVMRRTIVAIFIEILSGLLANRTSSTPIAATAFAGNDFVRKTCWQLLRGARFGFSDNERAAFIVRDADGVLGAIPWPSTGLLNGESWNGPVPPNTVAIVHTHRGCLPHPSAIDAFTARRRGIPVWVITPGHLYMTDGRQEFDVAHEEWRPRT